MQYKFLLFLFYIVSYNISFRQATILHEVRSLFANEKYNEVISLAESNSIDKSDSTYYYIGMSAYYLGNYKLAKTNLTLSELKKESNHKITIYTLAKIYEFELNYAKSIKYYKKLLNIDSTNSQYWRNYGHLCSQSSWNYEAELAYTNSLKLNPSEIQSIYGLIELNIQKDSISKAYDLILSTLNFNYENPKSLNYAARLAFKLREFSKTIAYLNSYDSLVDLSSNQQKLIGQAYLHVDSFDLSIHYLSLSLVDDKNP